MTLRALRWTLLLSVPFTGCGGPTSPPTEPPVLVSTEESLPEGRWEGECLSTSSDEGERSSHVLATIETNVLTMDTHGAGTAGISVDTFEYTERGQARWVTWDGLQVGTCVCRATVCTCDGVFPSHEHDSAIHRTMDFANGDLAILESGFLHSRTFEQRYGLRRR
jgi:hypothetical protein